MPLNRSIFRDLRAYRMGAGGVSIGLFRGRSHRRDATYEIWAVWARRGVLHDNIGQEGFSVREIEEIHKGRGSASCLLILKDQSVPRVDS